jgi:hypothetical protein
MQNIDFKDTRIVGIAAMVLIALAMALPWVTVSMPLMGSISVNAYKAGSDGWIFLGAVAVTGVFAYFRKTKVVGWSGVVLAVAVIADYVYNVAQVKHEMGKETDEFSKALADAVSINPGIGLILSVLIAGGLAGYALWFLPRIAVQQELAVEERSAL